MQRIATARRQCPVPGCSWLYCVVLRPGVRMWPAHGCTRALPICNALSLSLYLLTYLLTCLLTCLHLLAKPACFTVYRYRPLLTSPYQVKRQHKQLHITRSHIHSAVL